MNKKNRICLIIQARVGSTRLKNKILLDLHGYKIIEWVLIRTSQCKLVDEFILAIPKGKNNNNIIKYGLHYNYKIYRGEENNVLSRFYNAAKKNNATHIIRICADNPLVTATEIDRLIECYQSINCDYIYNHLPKSNNYPNGIGAEMVSFETLDYIFHNAEINEHKEHIFNYIWDNKSKFKIQTIDTNNTDIAYPELKLDIDTLSDYKWFKNYNITPFMKIEEIISIINNR